MWTVDPALPEARAVAIRGDRIAAVGGDEEILAMRGPQTRVVELRGRLLLPGFIDAHTHFGNAATWLFDVGLYEARDREAVLEKVAAHLARIPPGMWLRGGDIGAVAAWSAGLGARSAPIDVDRRALDAVSTRHAILLRRIDGALIANSLALARARIGRYDPDPRGGHVERDEHGEPTGLLWGRSAEQMTALVPPMTREWQLVGARVALTDLARAGITSIHDVARDDRISQRQIFHTDVERSFTDVEIFRELQARDELSVRVYAFLTLALWRDVVASGLRPGSEDGRIRYGALKALIDGWYMEEPYLDRPGYQGSWTFRVTDPEAVAASIRGADAAGFDPVVHTIGDKAHRLLLDWYEAAIAENGPRDRRFRVIHAWYPSAREIERIGRLGLIVDVTPAHCLRDGDIDRKLGPSRARTAHAWRSLMEAGARLDLVSDWPGSYNEKKAIPLDPLENIALAVGRTWHPEERLSVEEAIAAYTAHPAYASYEEDRKGRIARGLFADLVVVSEDILANAGRIAHARVDMTILGGRPIYERAAASASARVPAAEGTAAAGRGPAPA